MVMDTGSGCPSGQHLEPLSTRACGSGGTNQALNTPFSEPFHHGLESAPVLAAISLPGSTGTPGWATAKPKQPGNHLICATGCWASSPVGQEPEVRGRSWVLWDESGHKGTRKGCQKHSGTHQTQTSALPL